MAYWQFYLFTDLSTKLVTRQIKRILFVTVIFSQVDSFQRNTAHRTVPTVTLVLEGLKGGKVL